MVDHRRDGTMSEFVRKLLAHEEHGLTRTQIRERLDAVPDFAERLRKNRSTFGGMLIRLRERNEIKLIDDRFFINAGHGPT